MTPDQVQKLARAKTWRPLVAKVCLALGGVDANLVTALIAQESAGEPGASRYEKDYKYLWFPRETADRLGRTLEDEQRFQMTSWGLMQIMGACMREQGFEGMEADLTPEIALTHAVRHLKGLFHRWPTEMDWVSAYNQGSPRKTPGGLYEDQKWYVDPVNLYLRDLRQLA